MALDLAQKVLVRLASQAAIKRCVIMETCEPKKDFVTSLDEPGNLSGKVRISANTQTHANNADGCDSSRILDTAAASISSPFYKRCGTWIEPCSLRIWRWLSVTSRKRRRAWSDSEALSSIRNLRVMTQPMIARC